MGASFVTFPWNTFRRDTTECSNRQHFLPGHNSKITSSSRATMNPRLPNQNYTFSPFTILIFLTILNGCQISYCDHQGIFLNCSERPPQTSRINIKGRSCETLVDKRYPLPSTNIRNVWCFILLLLPCLFIKSQRASAIVFMFYLTQWNRNSPLPILCTWNNKNACTFLLLTI